MGGNPQYTVIAVAKTNKTKTIDPFFPVVSVKPNTFGALSNNTHSKSW